MGSGYDFHLFGAKSPINGELMSVGRLETNYLDILVIIFYPNEYDHEIYTHCFQGKNHQFGASS